MPRRFLGDSRRELALAGAGSLLVGAGLAFLPSSTNLVPVSLLQLALLGAGAVVAASSVASCLACLRRGDPPARMGSVVLAGTVLLGVVLPGAQLLSGLRQTRLTVLGVAVGNLDQAVGTAYGLFLLALLAFVLGERLVARANRSVPAWSGWWARRPSTPQSKNTYFMLLALGAAGAVLFPPGPREQVFSFSTRGQVQGAGIAVLLQTAVPLAVALAVVSRHWGSRTLVALSLVLTVGSVVVTGTRSYLLLIGTALLLRLLARSARKPLRSALGVGVLIYVAATLIVAVGQWRTDVALGNPASLSQSVSTAAENPFGHLAQGGVDTLDGLILATQVNRETVGASWTDPAKAVLGFIPHQIWPDKPNWLSADVSRDYTNILASGIFLSGPGYALLVFDGPLGMAAAFFVLGLLSAMVYRRLDGESIGAVLLTYFFVRFFFGGDAFDAFYVLGLALTVGVAYALSRAGGWLVRGIDLGSRRRPYEAPGSTRG
jgi:hypothetical protein